MGLAVDSDSGQEVGFINAISDGLLMAFIPLLQVVPNNQGQGISSELTRRMMKCLQDLYGIDLVCDPDLGPFYERFGLQRLLGMAQRNFDTQSGQPVRALVRKVQGKSLFGRSPSRPALGEARYK